MNNYVIDINDFINIYFTQTSKRCLWLYVVWKYTTICAKIL